MQSFEQLTFNTERLLLRPLVDADADALYAIFSDPEVMRYWSSPAWTSIDSAQKMIACDKEGMASGEHLRLGVVTKADGKLIGHCSLFSFFEQCKRAEIGYGMASAMWGRGLMHEALHKLVGYAFDSLALHRIEADIDPRNTGSARSLQRLGFLKEGHLRERWIIDGVISDTDLYGLLRREWQAAAIQSTV